MLPAPHALPLALAVYIFGCGSVPACALLYQFKARQDYVRMDVLTKMTLTDGPSQPRPRALAVRCGIMALG